MANILVLERTAAGRREFSSALIRDGHRVFEADSVEDFIPYIPRADIAMIDIDLPDGAGYKAAQCLHDTRPQAGVMILSERSDIDEKIRGLREYADQYLTKPIGPDMLSAYMAPMVRRFAAEGWRLDRVKRQLCSPDGHQEKLNIQEMQLMELLINQSQSQRSTVTRKTIATAFGFNWLDYDDRRLDQLVSRLRRRWSKASGSELPLHTDHGIGYRLSVSVTLQ
jgi:DNA-binding response OmpR family regulator